MLELHYPMIQFLIIFFSRMNFHRVEGISLIFSLACEQAVRLGELREFTNGEIVLIRFVGNSQTQ